MIKNQILLSLVLVISACSSTNLQTAQEGSLRTVYREDGKGTVLLNEEFWPGKNGGMVSVFNVDGKPFITREDSFREAIPFSDRRAIVRESGSSSLYFVFDSQSKTKKQLPHGTNLWVSPDAFRNRNLAPVVVMAYPELPAGQKSMDVTLFSALSREPQTIKDLGGPGVFLFDNINPDTSSARTKSDVFNRSVVRFPQFLALHFTAEDGKRPVSQILSLSGELIGPRMGAVRMFLSSPDFNRSVHGSQVVEAVSDAGPLPGRYFTGQLLRRPLTFWGELAKLPGDAIGVIPMREDPRKNPGWIVLYPSPEGAEGVLHLGTLASINKDILNQERVIDFELFVTYEGARIYWNLASQRRDGQWHLHPGSDPRYVRLFSEPVRLRPGVSFQSFAFQTEKDRRDREQQEFRAAFEKYYQANKASMDAKARADNAKQSAFLAELDRAPSICGRLAELYKAGPQYLDRYLRECPSSDGLAESMQKYGASPVLVSNVKAQNKQRQDRQAFELAEEKRRRDYARQSRSSGIYEALSQPSGLGDSSGKPGTPESGAYGAQQQRYGWQRQLNRQLYNKPYDPFRR